MTPERLALPTPFRIGTVNAYLLEGDSLALIDAGPLHDATLDALGHELALRGHGLDDLDLVVLTHQHYDHVGLARELQRRGAEVAAHETLAPFLADLPAAMDREDRYARAMMALHGVPEGVAAALEAVSRSYRIYGDSVDVDRVLVDGERLELGGLSLEVRRRPGHSPTDTLFVDEAQGIALAGDHLLPRISSNPTLHRPPEGSDDPRLRDSPLRAYLAALRETASLGLRTVLPGHGDPVDDAAALVAARLDHHAERSRRIGEALAPRPATAHALATSLWPALPVDQTYLALSEVLGHLDLLGDEGFARPEEIDGVIVYAATAAA